MKPLSFEESISISKELLGKATLDDLVVASHEYPEVDKKITDTLADIFLNGPPELTGEEFGKMVMACGLACLAADHYATTH